MIASKITKGLLVRARGYVESGYFHRYGTNQHPDRDIVYDPGERDNHSTRMLVRYAIPFEGVVVGTSHRLTGLNDSRRNRWEDNDAGLKNEKRHSVIMIQSTHTSKYQKPKACLLQDLELDNDR